MRIAIAIFFIDIDSANVLDILRTSIKVFANLLHDRLHSNSTTTTTMTTAATDDTTIISVAVAIGLVDDLPDVSEIIILIRFTVLN